MPDPDAPRRLFVPRRGARWRRLLNEAEVLGRLAQLGFVEVDLRSPRRRDCWRGPTASPARSAPASAPRPLFLPAGARLLFLRHDEMPLRGVAHSAALAGLRYAEAVDAAIPGTATHLRFDHDFAIPPAALEAAIENLGLI